MPSTKRSSLLLVLSFFLLEPAFAEFESYDVRPDVLSRDIPAQLLPANQQPPHWDSFKEGMVRFLAEAVAIHPEGDFYLMARDGEYIYDLARALFRDQPEIQKRFHLLNVSQASVGAQGLKDYLARKSLAGPDRTKKAIFLDTCCTGEFLLNDLIRSLEKDIKVDSQLITGLMEKKKSSRLALQAILGDSFDHNVMAFARTPAETFALILEHLPHYTKKAYGYEKIKGTRNGKTTFHWEPISKKQEAAQREKSLAIMSDVKAHGLDEKTRAHVKEMIREMKILVDMASGRKKLVPSEVAQLAKKFKDQSMDGFFSDLRENQRWHTLPIHPQTIHFWAAVPGGVPPYKMTTLGSKREDLINERPHLRPYIENPEDNIPLLSVKKDGIRLLRELMAHADKSTKTIIGEKILEFERLEENPEVILDYLDRDYPHGSLEKVIKMLRKPQWLKRPEIIDIAKVLIQNHRDMKEVYEFLSEPLLAKHPRSHELIEAAFENTTSHRALDSVQSWLESKPWKNHEYCIRICGKGGFSRECLRQNWRKIRICNRTLRYLLE